MKRIVLSLLTFGALLSADTVSVSYVNDNGTVPVNADNGYSAGPYTLNVNGENVLAMCLNDQKGVESPWTAFVTSANSSDLSNTYLGNNTFNLYGYQVTSNQLYGMATYLFSEIVQPGADRANLQLAAWSLTNGDTLGGVIDSGNQIVENDLLAAYSSLGSFNTSGFAILSDVTKTSQEFIVATPEPASFALLGFSLLAFGAARFASRRNKQSVAVQV